MTSTESTWPLQLMSPWIPGALASEPPANRVAANTVKEATTPIMMMNRTELSSRQSEG